MRGDSAPAARPTKKERLGNGIPRPYLVWEKGRFEGKLHRSWNKGLRCHVSTPPTVTTTPSAVTFNSWPCFLEGLPYGPEEPDRPG